MFEELGSDEKSHRGSALMESEMSNGEPRLCMCHRLIPRRQQHPHVQPLDDHIRSTCEIQQRQGNWPLSYTCAAPESSRRLATPWQGNVVAWCHLPCGSGEPI
jgi:hypothetical protein